MKRTPQALAIALAALALLSIGAAVQKAPVAPKAPDIVGTWAGYAIAPGMRFELTAVFDKGEAGYTGRLSDASGMLSEAPLREIVGKDGKLTFEFDLVMDMNPMLIKIELALENETLKGFWSNAEGSSDVVELALKK